MHNNDATLSGGPTIDFRGGRVDAIAPNTPGVPEPDQNITSHIDTFKRLGFNQTEMISLIACGHSFGGVQHSAVPTAVPDLKNPSNPDGQVTFDSTPATFDNKM